MIARIALNQLWKEFSQHLDGYLRHGVLYVYLTDQWDVLTLFHHKDRFLKSINEEISAYDPNHHIKDIRNKVSRDRSYSEEH